MEGSGTARAFASPGRPSGPIYIIVPEPELRLELAGALRLLCVDARPFDGIQSFAMALPELEPGCLLLDAAALPPAGRSPSNDFGGLRPGWPTILMFDAPDAEDAVRAIRLGASDLLQKPVRPEHLLDVLRRLAPRIREQRLHDASMRARQAIGRLSPRERQVVEALKEGLSSKEIARRHDLSHRTIEMYRGNIHRKLGVASVAQLLRIAWLAQGPGECG